MNQMQKIPLILDLKWWCYEFCKLEHQKWNKNENQHEFNGTHATLNGNFVNNHATNQNAVFWASKRNKLIGWWVNRAMQHVKFKKNLGSSCILGFHMNSVVHLHHFKSIQTKFFQKLKLGIPKWPASIQHYKSIIHLHWNNLNNKNRAKITCIIKL